MMPPSLDFFPSPLSPGSIGSSIGGMSIGGEPFPWQDTVAAQHANSPVMMNLIASFADAMSQKQNLDDFYDFVWNIQTCLTYGLDVWGRIVVIGRVIPVADTKFFGFEEGGTIDYAGFDQAPFYNGQRISSGFRLSDEAYRLLIISKAAANIWDGTIPALNAILRLLYPMRGPYVIDNGNMSMTYRFPWVLSPVEASVAISSGVLPRPCGVKVSYTQGP